MHNDNHMWLGSVSSKRLSFVLNSLLSPIYFIIYILHIAHLVCGREALDFRGVGGLE